MSIHAKARPEEIIILAAVGAAVALAVTSPLTYGVATYLPGGAGTWLDSFRSLLLWASAIAGAGTGAWYAARQERDTHLKGARYYDSPAEAAGPLQAQERAQFSAAQRRGEVHGITIGGVELARSRETSHLYVVGLTGGGKTVLLNSIIDQALSRGDRLIVHDVKGDLAQRSFDPAKCVMLGPWDARAVIWNAAADIDSPAQADEFAAAVTGAKTARGEDRHWLDQAASLLSGLIRSYLREGKTWTWADLREALAGDPVALVRRAAYGEPLVRQAFASAFPEVGSEAKAHITKHGESVLATLSDSVKKWMLAYCAVDAQDIDRGRFSLVRWLLGQDHSDVRMVFLNYDRRYSVACEQLFGAMIATVAATIASPVVPEASPDQPALTWCVFDEFPQLGSTALHEATAIAELGRSRGVRVVLALQDEAQLAARVGSERAAPILAQQVTRIYLRSSPQTAEAVCRRIGMRQVDRIETIAQNGSIAGKTKRAVNEAVILPSALMGLRVRAPEKPNGVEMIVHINDVLGKLVQPFPTERTTGAPAYAESDTWKWGGLPDDGAGLGPEPEHSPGSCHEGCPAVLPFDYENDQERHEC